MAFILGGCDFIGMKSGAINKHECSIVQAVEYNYREVENSAPYILLPKALQTEKTVVGFPLKGKNKGYAVILADAIGDPKVKILPNDVPFLVTKNALSEIREKTRLSDEVDKYLAAQIDDSEKIQD
ncbi:hypothetical protein M6G53_20360 [Serratia nevei]|uniref:hypothetical protein n=1 Tax=Serratia nevei TaxID=2703794 RepID=UPI00209F1AAC|nr:hypothetical protein [Serratia nevei]MCP1107727.1 hypothetical protein [Serratia nevei]